MKGPVLLIVGAVAGALMIAIAGVGASAHSSSKLTNSVSQGSSVLSHETSQNPETAETEVEANDTQTDEDTDTNDETEAPAPTATGEHENGDQKEASTTAEKD